MRFNSLFYIVLSLLIFTSCSSEDKNKEKLVAIGGKQYGGDFRFMSSEKVSTLFPTEAVDLYTVRLVSQIYEPLLRVDPQTMSVVSNVAESFTVSDDAKVYTFKIKKGILFHADACFGGKNHELDANDVKFSLDFACSGLNLNKVDYLLMDKIEGAAKYHDAKSLVSGGVSGIKVINANTIQITLVKPFAGFEKVLTHQSLGVFPQEAYKKYGSKMASHPVGSGPFMLESMTASKIVLKRNPAYWVKDEFGNQLPFLSKVVMTYSQDKKSELKSFRSAQTDIVLEIPVEEVNNIFGKLEDADKNIRHKVETAKSFSVNYIAMGLNNEIFDDVKVRMAFNLAINREEIVDSWLEGEGFAVTNGFVPVLPDYDTKSVKGHVYSPEKAKSLLAQAGYSNGRGFPALEFYVNAKEGSGIHKMCQGFATQIKENLNIDLKIKLCSLDERKAAISSGEAKIWRAGWVADYPDPETFLGLFYSSNLNSSAGDMVNSFKYQNAEFDKLYEEAIRESNPTKRNSLLAKCDQMIIDDAAIIPILTEDHIVMVNARIKEFKASPLEGLYLTNVYIKEMRK